MSIIEIDADGDTDAEAGSEGDGEAATDAGGGGDVGGRTSVSEVWPGRFALEVETGDSDFSSTTMLELDAEGLGALADQIDAALAEAHTE